MRSNKNKKNKKTSGTSSQSDRQNSGMRRIFLTGFWMILIGLGLWALMNFSTQSSELVPYTKVNKTEPAPGKEETPPVNREKNSSEQNINTGDLIQKASDSNSPQPNLPRETLEHIAKGMEMTEKGLSNQANQEFAKAAELSPESPELFSIWGAAMRMQKKYKGANKKFARAHELAPDDEEITFNWGLSRLEEQNHDEAVKLFEKTVQLAPNNYMALNYLGKSYGRKKLYNKEMDSYRKAIAIKPDFAQAHFNLGVVLSLRKKFEAAAPHFEKAIAIDKSFEKPFVVQMLTAMGRYQTPAPKKAETQPKTSEPVQEAKAVPPKYEEKKSEGSDHKMEGSKVTKDTTNVKGKVLINGKPPGPNAVVFLETKNKLKVAGQKTKELKIRQIGLQFDPQHTVVEVGSTITFLNEDREVHNIYSKSMSNQFNLGAMAAGSSKTIKITQAGPIVLRCNMHKEMTGTIFVVPNGYYTRPNGKGEYSFDNVASKGYILQFWHPSLDPELIAANLKSMDLTGEDQVSNFDIKSASALNEIHDLVDPTDYKAIVDHIEHEMLQAIADWKAGKKRIPTKRMLMAITKHYDGEGLKGAIAKSFSEKRSVLLERKMDVLRKQISGIGVSEGEVTEESLTSQAKFVLAQLRENVRELELRLKPDPEETKP